MLLPRLVGKPTQYTNLVVDVWPRIAKKNETPYELTI